MTKPRSTFLIIDGYVDEPTCLGVPFYISTYVRYVAGAIYCAVSDIDYSDIRYLTIEQLRETDYVIPAGDFIVLISGNPVPGKYLGGLPISTPEFETIGERNPDRTVHVGGPIRLEHPQFRQSNLKLVTNDIESFCYDYLSGKTPVNRARTIEEIDRFSVEGAFIVEQHPRYPDIIAEIETGRGCPREKHCSFCVEGKFDIEFRDVEGVISEIESLSRHGVRHFRLGKQADLFEFQTGFSDWKGGFPRPNPDTIERLYSGIRDKIPDLETLHLDNVNPGTLFHHPDESAQIAETVVRYNTPGDVAAFGLESADPEVFRLNRLKASPEQVEFAVKLINDIGGKREDGIPKLLPGINLIRGLPGESRDTFRLNYEFLLQLYQSGYLLRRINIRQIKPNPFTDISITSTSSKTEKKLDAAFRNYRKKIRDEIDHPMLKKVYPPGTLIRNVIIEQHRGDWSLGRNIGSYPIVINFPFLSELYEKHSAVIIGYRERSLVALRHPIRLSKLSYQEIKQIPGLSKTAGELFSKQNKAKSDLKSSPIFSDIEKYIEN